MALKTKLFSAAVAGNAISVEVQQFVARCIHSVEQLEILLVLNRTPERMFSVQEVFRQIQSSEKSVTEGLEFFVREGFVIAAEGGYRLSTDPNALRLVSDLERAYRERRVAVIELIYTRPSEGIQSFADAFRLRKKE